MYFKVNGILCKFLYTLEKFSTSYDSVLENK